jgi:superfamily II DNA or RNA helicase
MEVDAEVLDGASWDAVAARGFDPPHVFSAYLHTLRWNCVTATDPKLFQSPFRAGIKLDAYQIEPLRKALLLPRVNLFIADDVGLGKTIEAGLIARELLLRKKVRDVVVACPPSVLPQWQDELETRFGLTFAVLDREYVARARQERGYGVNPWRTHSRFLISQRLLIDEAYSAPLRDWLGDMRPGSLLVLDEAHHAAPSSGQRYAIDSRITRVVRDLAPRFEHRLFLSATPHNGHSNSFSALLEILDPQRFCRGVPVKSKKLLDEVMVRRLKEDVREVAGAAFPRRVVRQIDLDGLPDDAPELRLAALLDRYRRLREERLAEQSKRVRALAGLLVCGLQQRLLSSVEAFARTLRVHRRTVEKQAEREEMLGRRFDFDLLGEGPGSDDDRASLPEDELRQEEEGQVEAATRATSAGPPGEQERELLAQMTEIAEASRGLPDARVRELVEWIKANQCPDLPRPGAKWKDVRVVVFTEYDDTQRYLRQQLEGLTSATDRGGERIAVYNGPTAPARREEIKRAFNADPAKHPLRILIATDAAREGINLQAHCQHLFHFDVPWNPSRMEQRNGRIDRKLQPKPEVYCHYFFYRQRPEDRVLRRLVQKTETIKRELGSLAQVVEGRLAGVMAGGIVRRDLAELEQQVEAAGLDPERHQAMTEELELARERQDELRKQIEGLRTLLLKSREWIGLDEGHFRAAISASLELLGAEKLKPQTGDGSERFAFPELDRREGADPTWADTMDALRPPRPREQKPWQWRKEAAPRPVVFHDPGVVTDEVVHLHLEHRVVQRLLGRFVAQGFIHHDLSRSCLAVADDSIRRVVLVGRLCLYGPRAARLHEELIWVTARWVEPKGRDALAPYKRDAEQRTLALLESALLPERQRGVEPGVLDKLREAGPKDVAELLPHLEARGNEIADEAEQMLARRGKDEATRMREILELQRDAIGKTAERTEQQRDLFSDLPEERRQLESNKRHWADRLARLEQELIDEPARVESVYAVKARRIEPVGLVYLWPVTG